MDAKAGERTEGERAARGGGLAGRELAMPQLYAAWAARAVGETRQAVLRR